MNNQLIEKLIESNQQTCPQFIYTNPALDVNVTREVSKSLVKLIENTRDNENPILRRSILENIRNMCKNQPPGHADVDENITGLLIDVFQNRISRSDVDIDKQLEAFLIRTTKEVSLRTYPETTSNPEVVKALINLNHEKDLSDALSKNLIYWNTEDIKFEGILKDLWDQYKNGSDIPEDLSIKARSDIERLLLENTLALLEDTKRSTDDFTSNNDILILIKLCSTSPNCFQICTSILNSLFILSHFDQKLLQFIHTFVYSVKNKNVSLSFSILYPTHLTYVATLLDFDIDEIQQEDVKNKYLMTTINYLNSVKEKSENDLIMLLSHFPKWFEVYCQK